jgi:cation transport ATPase
VRVGNVNVGCWMDGYISVACMQADVKKYEAAQKRLLKAAEKAKKAAAKAKSTTKKPRGRKNEDDSDDSPEKRMRSRTPAGRTSNKTASATDDDEATEDSNRESDSAAAAVASQEEEGQDEDAAESTQSLEEEDNEEDKPEEESETVAAPLSQPASYKNITLPESFSLSWVFLFVFCVLSITVLRVVKDTDMKLLDADMQFNLALATMVLEPMPAFLAILAIMRYASPQGATLYSSRVCGALVWLICVDVFDKIDTVLPGFFDQAITKEHMVLFSLCMLLGFYGYALSADEAPHSPIVGMLTVAASGVVLSYFDMNPTVAPVVSAPLLLLCKLQCVVLFVCLWAWWPVSHDVCGRVVCVLLARLRTSTYVLLYSPTHSPSNCGRTN